MVGEVTELVCDTAIFIPQRRRLTGAAFAHTARGTGEVGEAEAVLRASEARERKEAETRARLKAGELGLDIYGMREKLAKKGLRYEDASGG